MTSQRDKIADIILQLAIYEGREGSGWVATAEDRDTAEYLHCQNAADAILEALLVQESKGES